MNTMDSPVLPCPLLHDIVALVVRFGKVPLESRFILANAVGLKMPRVRLPEDLLRAREFLLRTIVRPATNNDRSGHFGVFLPIKCRQCVLDLCKHTGYWIHGQYNTTIKHWVTCNHVCEQWKRLGDAYSKDTMLETHVVIPLVDGVQYRHTVT